MHVKAFSNDIRKFLKEMNEDEYRELIIVPLLRSMGYKKVRVTHGVTEFGKDIIFELKAVFANALGPNLRNEVAHGLLDDNAASSIESIYAWWMVLRLIIRSIMGLSSVSNNNANGEDEKADGTN